MKAALIIGTQLFRDHPALHDPSVDCVIMIEAEDLCRKLPYHQHKLVLVLSGMRHYADHVRGAGMRVIYRTVGEAPVFRSALLEIIAEEGVTEVVWMKPADTPTQTKFIDIAHQAGVSYEVHENQLFLTPESELLDWFGGQRNTIMEQFYRWQRQRTGILMDGTKPLGEKWNYDADNRQPLPKAGIAIPTLPTLDHDDITKAVIEEVSTRFSNHPGEAAQFWLPVTHAEADAWLGDFISRRFSQFGPYEDAMAEDEAFLFHSVLSPLLNNGLLSVQQVIDAALAAFENDAVDLSTVEGFIRQIIGWREYMYGLYVTQPDMKQANFFGYDKPLEDWWFTGKDIPAELPLPVKTALLRAHRYGYNHHIERLMVLGNWFLLNEYEPASVYHWFSAFYVDAYEWVMVPNVMGMSQYADGGKTATKPYISGGNYLQKMGRWWPSAEAARDSEFTALYWRFLQRQHDKLKNNFRMSLVLKQAQARKQD